MHARHEVGGVDVAEAHERQEHRDIPDPERARVVVYEPDGAEAVRAVVRRARDADVIVKCSGVGVFDDVLEAAVVQSDGDALRIFWDVDAPATLHAMESDHEDALRALIPEYDLVLTYGGGQPVVSRYRALGARRCEPVYNALDPAAAPRCPPTFRSRSAPASPSRGGPRRRSSSAATPRTTRTGGRRTTPASRRCCAPPGCGSSPPPRTRRTCASATPRTIRRARREAELTAALRRGGDPLY